MSSKDATRTSWKAFCADLADKLSTAGDKVIDEAPSELERSEGLRLLLRALRYSLERDIEERDVNFPLFAHVLRETVHGIADSPDYTIETAHIDGGSDYVIHGVMGQAPKVLIAAHRAFPNPVSSGSGMNANASHESSVAGTLDESDLDIAADGSFDIHVGQSAPKSGAWLKTTPDTKSIHVRNIFPTDFSRDRRSWPARLVIEKIGGARRPPAYQADTLFAGLKDVTANVGGALSRRPWLQRAHPRPNGVWEADQVTWQHANQTTYFQDMFWEIGPDEAMIIEVVPPQASFWSLIFTNYWMESLDFRYQRMYLNNRLATLTDDGVLRAVVAHRDPGMPNWIDIGDHSQGAAVWRWNDSSPPPRLPVSRVVPFSEL